MSTKRDRNADRAEWLSRRTRLERADSLIEKALAIPRRYGNAESDADHHRAWIIDQMVRALTGDGYAEWVRQQKAGEDGPDTYDWWEGVEP